MVISIQNSNNKSKVDLFFNQTVPLPIGFIACSSFISGSIIGGLITLNLDNHTSK